MKKGNFYYETFEYPTWKRRLTPNEIFRNLESRFVELEKSTGSNVVVDLVVACVDTDIVKNGISIFVYLSHACINFPSKGNPFFNHEKARCATMERAIKDLKAARTLAPNFPNQLGATKRRTLTVFARPRSLVKLVNESATNYATKIRE